MADAFYGPWLRFDNRSADNVWQMTALVVAQQEYNSSAAPELEVAGVGTFPGTNIDSFAGYNFWRFYIVMPLEKEQRQHTYSLHFEPALPQAKAAYTVTLPAINGQIHWGFKSCDWFSGGVSEEERARWGGYSPCWTDMLTTHSTQPLHIMINGGDQVYCDPVFKEVDELVKWAELTDSGQMNTALKYQPTPAAESTISQWYFKHYCTSFQREKFLEVMSSIPQINMYDDHDIWDGWGSYPATLQNCPMFQLIWKIAERFYLLFQQHTTKPMAPKHGFFGMPAYNFIKQITPEMAVLGMDMRAQRTLEHVIPPEGHLAIMKQLDTLPSSVKHLVVISAVPVVYPEVPFSETSMNMLTFWHQKMSCCGKKKSGLYKFGQAELSDDLVDHWGSSVHKKERNAMIARFQEYATKRSMRISFISGDVHLAAVGLLYSNPKAEDPATDPCWMLNVTSSASVNVPPPNGLVTAMTKTNHAHKINGKTKEKMVRLFKDAPGRLSDKLMPRRNWCEVMTEPVASGGDMVFTLRIEPQGPDAVKPNFQKYSITAPLVKANANVPQGVPIEQVKVTQHAETPAATV